MQVSLHLTPTEYFRLDEIAGLLDCNSIEAMLKVFAEVLIALAENDEDRQPTFDRSVN